MGIHKFDKGSHLQLERSIAALDDCEYTIVTINNDLVLVELTSDGADQFRANMDLDLGIRKDANAMDDNCIAETLLFEHESTFGIDRNDPDDANRSLLAQIVDKA